MKSSTLMTIRPSSRKLFFRTLNTATMNVSIWYLMNKDFRLPFSIGCNFQTSINGNLRHQCPDIKAKNPSEFNFQPAGDNKCFFPHSRWSCCVTKICNSIFYSTICRFRPSRMCVNLNDNRSNAENETLIQTHLIAIRWVFVQCNRKPQFRSLACKKAIERDDLIFNPIVFRSTATACVTIRTCMQL